MSSLSAAETRPELKEATSFRSRLFGIMTTPPASVVATEEPVRKSKEVDKKFRSFTNASSELLFVILPFIVIGIALAHQGALHNIFFLPEWSIVSAVIVGQSIVKVASAAVGKPRLRKEAITLIISGLLVVVLVPILSVLAIALTSTVTLRLAVGQAALFIISAVIFWLANALENYTRSDI